MNAASRGHLLVGRGLTVASLPRLRCAAELTTNTFEQPSTSGRNFCTTESVDSVHQLRKSLLQGALKHVKDRGWTDASLVAAARDLKLSPAVVGILLRGPGELVEYFIQVENDRFLEGLQTDNRQLQNLPLNERMAKALQMRLELIQPVIDSWPQALAVASKPSNAPHSLKLLLSLVDDVWAALGDDSTDITWYSKRAVLAGIYTSTSLYMLTDYSPGFKDTWTALRRRVDEGLALDASLQRLVHREHVAATTPAPAAPSAPAGDPAAAVGPTGGSQPAAETAAARQQ